VLCGLQIIISGIIEITAPGLRTGLAKEARFGAPSRKSEVLWDGAVEKGVEEIWKRAPNLRQQLIHEYHASGTQLFSYSGAPPS
jgi:hypothetical protein